MMQHRFTNPYLVLLASVFLPGSGHVMLGKAQRGLMFLFFIVVLGWISLRVMPASASFFARHVGGILVYGFAVLDAYKIARIQESEMRYRPPNPDEK
jgi:hypothetical protein